MEKVFLNTKVPAIITDIKYRYNTWKTNPYSKEGKK